MMNTVNRMILAATAASVVVLPVAAQAKTRAGDNGAVYTTTVAKPGQGRAAKGEKQVQALGFVMPLLTVSSIVASALVVAEVIGEETPDDDQSPTT